MCVCVYVGWMTSCVCPFWTGPCEDGLWQDGDQCCLGDKGAVGEQGLMGVGLLSREMDIELKHQNLKVIWTSHEDEQTFLFIKVRAVFADLCERSSKEKDEQKQEMITINFLC